MGSTTHPKMPKSNLRMLKPKAPRKKGKKILRLPRRLNKTLKWLKILRPSRRPRRMSLLMPRRSKKRLLLKRNLHKSLNRLKHPLKTLLKLMKLQERRLSLSKKIPLSQRKLPLMLWKKLLLKSLNQHKKLNLRLKKSRLQNPPKRKSKRSLFPRRQKNLKPRTIPLPKNLQQPLLPRRVLLLKSQLRLKWRKLHLKKLLLSPLKKLNLRFKPRLQSPPKRKSKRNLLPRKQNLQQLSLLRRALLLKMSKKKPRAKNPLLRSLQQMKNNHRKQRRSLRVQAQNLNQLSNPLLRVPRRRSATERRRTRHPKKILLPQPRRKPRKRRRRKKRRRKRSLKKKLHPSLLRSQRRRNLPNQKLRSASC